MSEILFACDDAIISSFWIFARHADVICAAIALAFGAFVAHCVYITR